MEGIVGKRGTTPLAQSAETWKELQITRYARVAAICAQDVFPPLLPLLMIHATEARRPDHMLPPEWFCQFVCCINGVRS
eukprot:15794005-Heterocapsa_arctica.AAC.1